MLNKHLSRIKMWVSTFHLLRLLVFYTACVTLFVYSSDCQKMTHGCLCVWIEEEGLVHHLVHIENAKVSSVS